MVFALLFLLGLASSTATVFSAPLSADPLQDLLKLTGGQARISRDRHSGLVRFIGTDKEHGVPRRPTVASSAPPETAARAFLASYGALFGLSDPSQELTL